MQFDCCIALRCRLLQRTLCCSCDWSCQTVNYPLMSKGWYLIIQSYSTLPGGSALISFQHDFLELLPSLDHICEFLLRFLGFKRYLHCILMNMMCLKLLMFAIENILLTASISTPTLCGRGCIVIVIYDILDQLCYNDVL